MDPLCHHGPMVTQPPLNDGKWHHMAATFGGQSARIYADGKLYAQALTAAEVADCGAHGA